VPDELNAELVARAARSGRSLEEYLLRYLTNLATRPAKDDGAPRPDGHVTS
jgi:antitoxin FitA